MTIYRKNYTPSPWKQEKISLHFSIPKNVAEPVLVTSLITYIARDHNLSIIELHGDLLKGDQLLKLQLVHINQNELIENLYNHSTNNSSQNHHTQGTHCFKLPQTYQAGDTITILCETQLNPIDNKTLMGLYVSNGRYYTQCEPEGFRHITYCLDRPDELAKIDTIIEFPHHAITDQKPLTLGNGEFSPHKIADTIHSYIDCWSDTIPKPTYLFALVIAQDLESIQDEFITMSGKKVTLGLYAQQKDVKRLHHAMNALKDSMQWDEEIYGREVDTSVYNIVAVDDFNMGAMENKNLNIFNTAFVLADQDIATDIDFLNVSSVVAHEYFHNWTGNRITCRDWFQLTLKEGLTVYRDQCFTDTITKTARLDDIKTLKAIQWAEDNGPMKHAIRPDSYETINNFYTSTIYEKGAEVIRMLHKLVGQEHYRHALNYYFDTFDGQAVTCDDFLQSFIATTNNLEKQQQLQQFGNWYSQMGKVVVQYQWQVDHDNNSIIIDLKQFSDHQPSDLVIPIDGVILCNNRQNVENDNNDGNNAGNIYEYPLPLMVLNQAEQSFTISLSEFESEILDIALLKGFSAPVELILLNNSNNELENYLDYKAHFTDEYLVYNNFQHYFKLFLSGKINGCKLKNAVQLFFNKNFTVVDDNGNKVINVSNYGLIAQTLTLPSFDEVVGFMCQENTQPQINPQNYMERRHLLEGMLKDSLPWEELYHVVADSLHHKVYNFKDADARRLKNLMLVYMANEEIQRKIAMSQLKKSDNLTDRLAGLRVLMKTEKNTNIMDTMNTIVFNDFYQIWKEEALIIDKWFGVQAQSEFVLPLVNSLLHHEAFYRETPNRCRSLLMNLFKNPTFFHQKNGEGYELWANEVIKINAFNPQLSSRLARCMEQWRVFDDETQQLMSHYINVVKNNSSLTTDVREVIEKMINS